MRWNNKVLPEPKHNSVLDLIRLQTIAHPTSLAVSAWDGDMTYSRLDDLSSRLAQHIRFRVNGVGLEAKIIPICFEHSVWAIVAILAVLKSGNAYCPLDPELPLQRLQISLFPLYSITLLASFDPCRLRAFKDMSPTHRFARLMVLLHPLTFAPSEILLNSVSIEYCGTNQWPGNLGVAPTTQATVSHHAKSYYCLCARSQ